MERKSKLRLHPQVIYQNRAPPDASDSLREELFGADWVLSILLSYLFDDLGTDDPREGKTRSFLGEWAQESIERLDETVERLLLHHHSKDGR